MDMIFVFFLVLGIQSLIVALILLFYKSKKQKVNKYLGFFFVFVSVELFSYTLMRDVDPYIASYNPFRFNFLNMVFIYFYAIKTAGIEIRNKYWYYIPGILEFCILSLFFVKVNETPDLVYSYNSIIFLYSYIICCSIFIAYMCVKTLLVVRSHTAFLPFFYTDTKYKSLLWLTIFCIIFIVYHIIAVLSVIVLSDITYMATVSDSLSLLLLYYFTIGSLMQINIVNITSEKEVKLSKHKQEENKEIYKQVSKAIEQCMVEEKAFLDPDITLKAFAKKVGESSRLISKTINEMEYKNFNMYLNYYRVEEFKMLIESEKYQKYSNTALAKEAGFNSRASFYKNFKDIAGISPSDYLESLN